MQRPPVSSSKSTHWLDITEILSAVGATGGTAIAIATQQIAYVAAPLTLSVVLNLINRNRLLAQINQNSQTRFAVLTEELNQSSSVLGRELDQQRTFVKNLNERHQQTTESVKCLRAIANCTQAANADRADDQVYYLRGISHHRLGDYQEAIEDYTSAIEHNSKYAKAHFNRGIANGHVGDKRSAVQDLRAAAKFFFEDGDVDNYQKARDLSRDFHDMSPLDSQTELITRGEIREEEREEEEGLVIDGFLG
ncbi:MAG: tetratricopeptide repeat protein [Cyanobacteria bacterium P01_D01_bin.123]